MTSEFMTQALAKSIHDGMMSLGDGAELHHKRKRQRGGSEGEEGGEKRTKFRDHPLEEKEQQLQTDLAELWSQYREKEKQDILFQSEASGN